MISLQRKSGIYVLLLNLDRDIIIKVGSLGKLFFKKGKYAYIGSAQLGLEKRIKRHLSKQKRKFWHIDYVLSKNFANVFCTYYKKAAKSEECNLASFLCKKHAYIYGFGCSDCNCLSHLIFFGNLIKKGVFSDLGFKTYKTKTLIK